MHRGLTLILSVSLATLGSIGSGCASGTMPPIPGEAGPRASADGYARSVVTDHPALRRAVASGPVAPELPWYAARNDARLATDAGYQPPTYLYSTTRTIDRQIISAGRARTYFSETIYRGQTIEAVR
jgi:hypothetical protein